MCSEMQLFQSFILLSLLFYSALSIRQIQDKGDFDSKLADAGNKLVVVDFYATWCGPCKMIAPKLEDMSKEMSDVEFLKVDVDECEEVAQEFDINVMPTFVLFKNKQKVEDFSGANADKLRELIEKQK